MTIARYDCQTSTDFNLDDSASALDFATDAKLREAIRADEGNLVGKARMKGFSQEQKFTKKFTIHNFQRRMKHETDNSMGNHP